MEGGRSTNTRKIPESEITFGLHAEISVVVITKWTKEPKRNHQLLAAKRQAATMFVFLVRSVPSEGSLLTNVFVS